MNEIEIHNGEYWIMTLYDMIGPFSTIEQAEIASQQYDRWDEEDSKPEYRKFKDSYE